MSHLNQANEYFVTLLSNNSMKWYPKNTLSSFTNNLPVGLALNNDWVVGLIDLYIPRFHVIEYLDSEEYKTTEITLGGKKYVFNKEEKVLLQKPDDEKIKTIFFYCDIIKPRIIGDSFVKCIKLLHVTQEAQYLTFPRVEYHPLASFCIGDITILLQDDTGKQIKFYKSYKPTSCTLHFKRVAQ